MASRHERRTEVLEVSGARWVGEKGTVERDESALGCHAGG